jgi:hypothetical protein
MTEVLLKVLGPALSLWEHKEKHKYIDRWMELKKAYYEESNKDLADRDDAVLDSIRFELCLLGSSFAAHAEEQKAAD